MTEGKGKNHHFKLKQFRGLCFAILLSFLLWGSAPAAFASDDIAKPFHSMSFSSQSDLLKSLRSVWKVIRDIPFDVYRCAGLLTNDGWTGRVIRRHPEVETALKELFAYRLSDSKAFEGLCFINDGSEFRNVTQTSYGTCAGVTTMNWLGNYLALFDQEGKAFRSFHKETEFALPKGYTPERFKSLLARKAASGAIENPDLDAENKKILSFYLPYIDRIFREHKPTVIPFFEDLHTFSSHPALNVYLKKLVIETWFDVNVSLSSIFEILVIGGRESKKLKASEMRRFDDQLQSYLRHRIQPIIFIHLPKLGSEKKRIHVLRVLSSEWVESTDSYVVKVVDPNFHAGGNIHELRVTGIRKNPDAVHALYIPYQQLQVDKTGTARSLTEIELMPFFDRMSAGVMQNWRDFLNGEGGQALEQLEAAAKEKVTP